MNKYIILGNPFHDAVGRFAARSGSSIVSTFSSGGGVMSAFSLGRSVVSDISKGGIHLNLTPEEKKIILGKVSGIQSDMKKSISGINSTSISLSESTKEWADKFNTSEANGNMIFGVAKKNEIILSPVAAEILTGNTNGINYKGINVISKESSEELASHVIIHETFHKRDRKYSMEFMDEPGMEKGLFVDIRKYDMRKEEGANEFLSQVTAVKLGVSTKESILTNHNNGALAYPKDVHSMITEARARYSDSPEKAIEFINDAHKTGFSLKGIEESFGNKWARNGRERLGDGIMDSITFNDVFHWKGKGLQDREWIMSADLDKIHLDIWNNNTIIILSKLNLNKILLSEVNLNNMTDEEKTNMFNDPSSLPIDLYTCIVTKDYESIKKYKTKINKDFFLLRDYMDIIKRFPPNEIKILTNLLK